MKIRPSVPLWFSICISFAIYLRKVEPSPVWGTFMLFFFLGQIYLYGWIRRNEDFGPPQALEPPQGEAEKQ